jgi:protoporphyrinogen oxidase
MTQDVVLGAGIAGLAAAHYARRHGRSPVLYEAAARAGGILDSFSIDDWRFDNGVHLSFASEPEVRAIFDQTPVVEHEPISLGWDNGYWLRYPVQNNMYPLPAKEKAELIVDLVARPEIKVETYRDWLVYQYGAKIAERWPIAYTRKYWTIEAECMGIGWIGSRMRRADLGEVLLGAMSADTPNTYYISRMRYPVRGGYRAFIEPLIREADIRTNHRAVSVNWRARRIRFGDGSEAGYDRLISTIPLPELISIMSDVPDAIAQTAATLFATRADLISIGFTRPDVSPSLWFYIYDSDILASRAYSPSRKSPHNAPESCSSLQFEIYSSPYRPMRASPDELKENCIYAVEKMHLANRREIAFMHHKVLPYANVVFDLGMEQRRDSVRNFVRSCSIELAGRYGEWEYLWSNQSFMSGMRAAAAVVDQSAAHFVPATC